MRTTRTNPSGPIRRPGFTLLEILLAVALLLLLMGAVSQSISMYVTLSSLGREEVEQSQIGRAVLQQIAVDIRSITFQPAPEEDLEMEGAPADDEIPLEDDLGGDSVLDDDEPTGPVLETGIVGNNVDLILYTSRPDRRMEYIDRELAVSPTDRISDALTVRYFLAKPTDGGVSGEFARSELGPGVVKDVVGLARLEGDRTTMNQAITDGNVDVQVEATKLLAKEVVEVQFRYFSNGEWYDEWDTMQSNTLPAAIEVKIVVQLQPEVEQSRFVVVDDSDEEERTLREFKRIVAIPMVPPVEAEEL